MFEFECLTDGDMEMLSDIQRTLDNDHNQIDYECDPYDCNPDVFD